MDTTPAAHYQRPNTGTRAFNWLISRLTRLGVSVWGSRVLEVKGRKSGLPRRTPVNLLTIDGREYLVAPRGETEWVRNLRADGGRLALLLGRRREQRLATEIADDDKAEILRAYLRRWKFEVGMFFDGVGPDSSDAELVAAGARHPVFALSPSAA